MLLSGKMKLGVLAVVSLAAALSGVEAATDYAVYCYFGSWSVYRYGLGKFDVEDIDPFACTHLSFGFAGLNAQDHTVQVLDPYNELYDNWGKGAYDRFTGLKRINPNLVTLLAIGGWNEGSIKYSDMARTPETRAIFIQSVLDMIDDHDFDGIDMDWEYPGGRDDSPGYPEDRENFSALLRELRAALDGHAQATGRTRLYLTAAVSAGYATVDQSYDVPVLAENTDYINIMSYDYHGWFPNQTLTGHNSPKGPIEVELQPGHPGYHLNQEFSLQYWIDQGAIKEKLLLGMATYGRGFLLQDPANNGLYVQARAGIQAGKYTGQAGFWGYHEFCEKLYSDGELNQWEVTRVPEYAAPYAVNGDQWFSYDDPESLRIKSEFVKAQGLGGAMVWSVDTDDFHQLCGGNKFQLISEIQEVLNGGFQTAPPGYTTPTPPPDATTGGGQPTGPTPPPDELCDGSGGLKPDPDNCHQFYQCVPTGDGWNVIVSTCGDTLAFDPINQVCTYPEDVPGCT